MQKNNGKEDSNDFVSIIYNQKNDSPKYFQLKKSKLLLFVIGLPSLTLLSLILGGIGLIHTSPFHLMDNYKQNAKAREAVAITDELLEKVKISDQEKIELTAKLTALEDQLKADPNAAKNNSSESSLKCPAPTACPTTPTVNSIGLSTLSLFKPIQGQHDRTRPATLNLSGFKVVGTRDTTNLQFNIIPPAGGEARIAGHIIVLMKNELTIQVYPPEALSSSETQLNYATGETFSTQRFRPVDAHFLKPRKPGNYTFTVFIFARNGDLLHFQSVILPVKF